MNEKISKTNVDVEFFNRRLDEVRMSSYERLMAKAHFARAEAVADLFLTLARAIARLFKAPSAKPGRHAAPSAG
jgi:hypothetical protein